MSKNVHHINEEVDSWPEFLRDNTLQALEAWLFYGTVGSRIGKGLGWWDVLNECDEWPAIRFYCLKLFQVPIVCH